MTDTPSSKLAEWRVVIHYPGHWEESRVEAALTALEDLDVFAALEETAKAFAESREALGGCRVDVVEA